MPAPIADAVAAATAPLTADPLRAAVFCDIDGTLAPIVRRPEESHVREEVPLLLSKIGRRYGCVACVSGRPVTEARRLIGAGAIAYAGHHGAEILRAGAARAKLDPAFASWEGRVRKFVRAVEDRPDLKAHRVRIEDKGPIKAFHWRDVPDEAAAETWLAGIADEAQTGGLEIHWGRKVLEIRPPIPFHKGMAVEALLDTSDVRVALYGGDDATDLDAFNALDALVASGRLDHAVRVGVRSEEGPAEIVERADLVVEGVPGFIEVLAALARE